MFCPYCGRKFGEDFVFCPSCGKKIPDTEEIAELRAEEPKAAEKSAETEKKAEESADTDFIANSVEKVKSAAQNLVNALSSKSTDNKALISPSVKKRKVAQLIINAVSLFLPFFPIIEVRGIMMTPGSYNAYGLGPYWSRFVEKGWYGSEGREAAQAVGRDLGIGMGVLVALCVLVYVYYLIRFSKPPTVNKEGEVSRDCIKYSSFFSLLIAGGLHFLAGTAISQGHFDSYTYAGITFTVIFAYILSVVNFILNCVIKNKKSET